MTFLAVLFGALYEPSQKTLYGRCAPHPFHASERVFCQTTEYCADMTVLLAYYNALDDWHDDKNIAARGYARLLKHAAEAAAEQYPEKSRVITENLEKMNGLERQREINLDAVSNCFGQLLGELFVMRQDRWADTLRTIGENLGKFVYFMDAYEDADRDSKHKNYNPLLQVKGQADYEQTVKQILTMFLADAAAAFETLPIVEDAEILRNILYAGAWSKYTVLQERKNDR